MKKYIYFGEGIPREIEQEYNRMIRQEQYQLERDMAHGVGTPAYDPLLQHIVDRTLTSEYQAELEAEQVKCERLAALSIAMDWLRLKSPDDYKLIHDYYYAKVPITLINLAKQYGVSKQALSKRLTAVRDKLRTFIIMHENIS